MIVREDLLGQLPAHMPTMYDYRVHADADSMYNTPPTYAIYIAGLVFPSGSSSRAACRAWPAATKKSRPAVSRHRQQPGFYHCPVETPFRSRMNVPFRLGSPELEAAFLAKPSSAICCSSGPSFGRRHARVDLQRHAAGRVKTLANFMVDFARRHG